MILSIEEIGRRFYRFEMKTAKGEPGSYAVCSMANGGLIVYNDVDMAIEAAMSCKARWNHDHPDNPITKLSIRLALNTEPLRFLDLSDNKFEKEELESLTAASTFKSLLREKDCDGFRCSTDKHNQHQMFCLMNRHKLTTFRKL